MTGRPSLSGVESVIVRALGASQARRASGAPVASRASGAGRVPGASVALAAGLALAACSPAPPAATPEPAPGASATATSAPPASAAIPGTAASTASTTASTASRPPLPPVTLVQVERTRLEGKPPVLGIDAPAKNLVIPASRAAAFEVRVSARGGKLAAGDHLCLVLDKQPCRRVEDPAKAVPLGDLGPLDEGQHVVSVLARRANGELYRTGKSAPFASVSFFVGKRVPPVHKDGAPMLFYTAPDRGPAPGDGVLIDFFLANADVRSGTFVIAASVGGPGIESGVGMLLETDRPVRIKNARPGEYLSRLTLLEFVPDLGESKSVTTVTYTSKPVRSPFAEVERSIFVTK